MTLDITKPQYDALIGLLYQESAADTNAIGSRFLLDLHGEEDEKGVSDFLGRLARYNQECASYVARINEPPRMELTETEAHLLTKLLRNHRITLPKRPLSMGEAAVRVGLVHLVTSAVTQNPLPVGGAIASIGLEALPLMTRRKESETHQEVVEKFLDMLNQELVGFYLEMNPGEKLRAPCSPRRDYLP